MASSPERYDDNRDNNRNVGLDSKCGSHESNGKVTLYLKELHDFSFSLGPTRGQCEVDVSG